MQNEPILFKAKDDRAKDDRRKIDQVLPYHCMNCTS